MIIVIFYRKTDRRGNLLFVAQLLLTLPIVGLAALGLFSSEWLLAKAHTALEILSGYLMWYRVMQWGGIALLAVAVIVNILIFISLIKHKSFAPQHIYMALLSLLIICIFSAVMVVTEGVPSLIQDATTDIAAINNKQLISVTGQLTPEKSSRSLAGPYMEDGPTPVAKTTLKPLNEELYYVYLPVDKKAIISEGSTFFDITYTPKFNVVVDVIPATIN